MSLAQKINFKDQVALITGAGHGIGKVIALELAKEGANVAVADISEEKGSAVVSEIKSLGFKAEFFALDLSSKSSISKLVEDVGARFKKIDILINNARPKLKTNSFAESLEEWDLGMAVLLNGPALLSGLALKHFPITGGNIVNLVSVASQFVSQQPAVYHVAKAGLVQLTRVLAVEYASRNIRVNAVCPGVVDLYDENRPLTSNPINKASTEIVVPMKRAGRAEEISDCVLFLCSSAASYVTGHVLMCEGGETLQDHFHVVRQALNSSKEQK